MLFNDLYGEVDDYCDGYCDGCWWYGVNPEKCYACKKNADKNEK